MSMFCQPLRRTLSIHGRAATQHLWRVKPRFRPQPGADQDQSAITSLSLLWAHPHLDTGACPRTFSELWRSGESPSRVTSSAPAAPSLIRHHCVAVPGRSSAHRAAASGSSSPEMAAASSCARPLSQGSQSTQMTTCAHVGGQCGHPWQLRVHRVRGLYQGSESCSCTDRLVCKGTNCLTNAFQLEMLGRTTLQADARHITL